MAIVDTAPEKTLFGHPRGLTWLFTTEMWERFSYYGMRAILVLYLTQFLLLHPNFESVIGYHAVKHVLEVIFNGGRPLDVQPFSSLIYGNYTAFVYLTPFFGGLLLLIVGNGFFKPNISTQVGNLYKAGDSRIDRAFSIFYVGINVGATASPLVCGYLANDPAWGYKWGFCAAGIGMVIGQIIYIFALRTLPKD